jgi:hypothetical protein
MRTTRMFLRVRIRGEGVAGAAVSVLRRFWVESMVIIAGLTSVVWLPRASWVGCESDRRQKSAVVRVLTMSYKGLATTIDY